ncbi:MULTISPECIES: hypothetical protein [Sphingobacterium]|uniref:Uncharacterized protein n=1 Tax=Sphingobacterium multivorum TaxID=28454 RepID=A0A654AZF5_SPHMU|nr:MULTISPECIES: hypothetical protein [Sphingobacterium]QQT43261.1 hypothetical protein I6J00_16060 [Sphingobacterium multivorum]QRQ60937.1 hypothetical protein I6J33_22995 [Sphingobacterium multivorum]VXC72540.1 hypothetical protein SPHINGO8BC_150675 [Sphingobacterium multivorum]
MRIGAAYKLVNIDKTGKLCRRKETATQDITGDGRISVGPEQWQNTGYRNTFFCSYTFLPVYLGLV